MIADRPVPDQKINEGPIVCLQEFPAAANLSSFDPQSAAVGIRGIAGAVGIPGAERIVDRVRRERRNETGLSRLSGLFGQSC
jgi:hypothetical protein